MTTKNKFRAWNSTKREMEYMLEDESIECFLSGISVKENVFGYEYILMENAGITGITIFEGDITSDMLGYGIVKFIEGSFVTEYASGANDYLDGKTKIIGNIYENTELI